MLVKKKNPNWFPHENNALKVGETIEITDPKQLILDGDVTGLAEDGTTELSAYELYGVIVANEAQEFQEYIKMKKAEAQQAALQKEAEALKAEIAASTPAPVTEPTPEPTPAPVEAPVVETPAPVVEEKVATPKKK